MCEFVCAGAFVRVWRRARIGDLYACTHDRVPSTDTKEATRWTMQHLAHDETGGRIDLSPPFPFFPLTTAPTSHPPVPFPAGKHAFTLLFVEFPSRGYVSTQDTPVSPSYRG